MARLGQTSLPSAAPDLLVLVGCDASVSVGDWVRINSSNIAVKALADDKDNANVVGLCEEKISPTLANIRTAGVTRTMFTGLDPTKNYFLSDVTSGAMVIQGVSVPTTSGHVIVPLGNPLNDEEFIVRIGQRIVRS